MLKARKWLRALTRSASRQKASTSSTRWKWRQLKPKSLGPSISRHSLRKGRRCFSFIRRKNASLESGNAIRQWGIASAQAPRRCQGTCRTAATSAPATGTSNSRTASHTPSRKAASAASAKAAATSPASQPARHPA